MEKQTEQCCIYIDDSNLFIEGMKFLASDLSLDVKQDHRFRIEPASFVKALARDRSIKEVIIYGSGTVHKSSVWKVWRESGVRTKVFQRCLKGQEKEVDSTLAADVVDKAACLRFKSRGLEPGSVTFIVVSGDRDYLQALRKVLKHKWKLEVVGWAKSMSMRVKEFVKGNEHKGASLIDLNTLAERDSSIYFIESRYSVRSEIQRSGFVFEYSSKQSEEDAKALSFHVAKLIKRPCQYYFTEKDSRIVTLVLLVQYNSQSLKQKHKWLLRNAFSHGCGLRISFQSTLALKEDDEDSDTEQDDEDEYYEDSENEDEGVVKDEDKEKADDEDDSDDEDEDKESADNNDESDGDDEEQTEKERLEEEEAVKTGNRCVHKYRCSNAKRCPLYHTKSEKKHFSTNARHLGKLYKSQLCRSVKNPEGINGRRFKCPKRCPYAHSLKEARCYNCDPGGLVGEHWMDDCPRTLYSIHTPLILAETHYKNCQKLPGK